MQDGASKQSSILQATSRNSRLPVPSLACRPPGEWGFPQGPQSEPRGKDTQVPWEVFGVLQEVAVPCRARKESLSLHTSSRGRLSCSVGDPARPPSKHAGRSAWGGSWATQAAPAIQAVLANCQTQGSHFNSLDLISFSAKWRAVLGRMLGRRKTLCKSAGLKTRSSLCFSSVAGTGPGSLHKRFSSGQPPNFLTQHAEPKSQHEPATAIHTLPLCPPLCPVQKAGTRGVPSRQPSAAAHTFPVPGSALHRGPEDGHLACTQEAKSSESAE